MRIFFAEKAKGKKKLDPDRQFGVLRLVRVGSVDHRPVYRSGRVLDDPKDGEGIREV